MLYNFQKLIIIDTARENHAALKMDHACTVMPQVFYLHITQSDIFEEAK